MSARGLLHSRWTTILDQGVSSLSNFALVALVARSSTPVEFGRFSLAYLILIFFLGFGRALVGEAMLVRYSGEGRPTGGDRAPAGLAVLTGVAGLVLLGGGAMTAGAGGAVWLLLALACPVVLVQDVLRYLFIARGRSGHALLLDAIWALPALAAMVLLVSVGADAAWIVAVWLIGAAVSAGVGLALARTVPAPVAGIRWLWGNRDLAIRFSAEYSSLNLSTTLVWFVLAGPVGAAGIAALRGASLLFSPLNTGFNAVRIAMIPELVRLRPTTRYRRRLAETGGILLVLGAGWGGAVLLLPDTLGRELLGASWAGAADLRLANLVQAIAMVGYTVLLALYRSSALHRESTVMRGVLAAATLVVPVALALAAGTSGAAWGFAVAVGLAVATGAVAVLRSRRSAPRLEAADVR